MKPGKGGGKPRGGFSSSQEFVISAWRSMYRIDIYGNYYYVYDTPYGSINFAGESNKELQ